MPGRLTGRSFDQHDEEPREQAEATGGASFGRVLHCFELHGLFSSMKNCPLHVYDSFGCNNVRE
jgi:hypothetical protein